MKDIKIHHFDTVDSTNTLIKSLIERGEAHPFDVVWANHQTAGRGRHGRTWEDVPGKNLLISTALHVATPVATWVPLLAAVAMRQALNGAGAQGITIKWPNDLIADGTKVAGILTEYVETTPEGLATIIVGIGVNIAAHPTVEPPVISDNTDAAYGHLPKPGALTTISPDAREHIINAFIITFKSIISEYDTNSSALAHFRDLYLEGFAGLNQAATIRDATGNPINVWVKDIDTDGALIVADTNTPGAPSRRITSGDVALIAL